MIFTRDKSFYRSLVALAIPVAPPEPDYLHCHPRRQSDGRQAGGRGGLGRLYGRADPDLLQMFSGGIEGAILILAAQYWGRRDTGSIKRIVSIGLHFSIVCGLVLTAVCIVFPRPIISIFASDPSVIEEGTNYLRTVCFSYVFFCVTQALIAAMRSVEVARIGDGGVGDFAGGQHLPQLGADFRPFRVPGPGGDRRGPRDRLRPDYRDGGDGFLRREG